MAPEQYANRNWTVVVVVVVVVVAVVVGERR